MEQEIWKDVIGFEFYQVSNLGRVKSNRFKKEKILKSAIGNHGYLLVSIYKDKKRYSRTVHQIVAESFLNHKPCGSKVVVDHIDNNRLNNIVENLRLVSTRENTSKKNTNTSSKYIGVVWHKRHKKWMSAIMVNGFKKYLGYFNTEIDAYNAYCDELNKINIGI